MKLTPILRPQSIAIIGASNVPTRVGGITLALLQEAGYRNVYPINPKYGEIAGVRCFPDIEAIPHPVELVLVSIGADDVLPYLERCHARGVKAAIIFAAGYAETNEPQGIARQTELAAFAKRSGMLVAGPNCMGNANLVDGIFTTFGTSFRPGDPAGDVALVTQSGNMCAVLYRMARRAGVAFSHVINTGNEVDVELSDYLQYLADDDATNAALCYIEELRDGPAFMRAAAAFRRRGKLLALYKVGASEKGAEAARSHTAALAGNAVAYSAAFAASGVVRVSDLAGLAELAYLQRFGSRIGGNACVILSVSGAAGAILADVLSLNGGQVPTLPAAVQAALRAKIPAFGMVSNPVDLTGNLVNANDFLYEAILQALSPADIDVLLLYLPGYFLQGALAQVERAAAQTKKAIIVIDTFALGDREKLAAAGIAYFDDFDRAARAVAAYGAWKTTPLHTIEVAPSEQQWPAWPQSQKYLSETAAKDALAAFGVPVIKDVLVQTRGAAQAAAAELGYPLVLKLVSPDVAHKTEHGLVRLGIANAEDVGRVFDDMMHKAGSMAGVRIEGVTLEPMLKGGVEILAGVTKDPVFGWMLSVGLGGVWTELMSDASHRLLPVDAPTAETMLRSLKGFRLLDGYRGAPKADIKAAAHAIAALGSAVLAGQDHLSEVEINPLLVMPAGQGAVAVDALVMLLDNLE